MAFVAGLDVLLVILVILLVFTDERQNLVKNPLSEQVLRITGGIKGYKSPNVQK